MVPASPSLMGLPYELRYRVLRLLMAAERPIYFEDPEYRKEDEKYIDHPGANDPDTTRLLWPEIVACCRQLYEESMPILYGNTIGIRVGRLDVIRSDDELWVAENRPDSHACPRFFSPKLDRLSAVDITVYRCPRILEYNQATKMREVLRRLTAMLESRPHWTTISIRVCDHRSLLTAPSWMLPKYRPVEQYANEVLQPLLQLRNRRVLHLQGVDPQMASKLRHYLSLDGPSQTTLL